ncbi:sporulation peptidase YabG [Clostridium grantii]|uniref:Spore coat assemly protein n=1 Tax=Clostridium grantii DSM 8605 TaxID=1121316 RepID=A0A1M5TLB1_9CLOT|nr:sporulation peptidase YabG [Clostridium grantii]SHH51466.1 spore coat assemly protein [Clostridium grantii DSM 8605]
MDIGDVVVRKSYGKDITFKIIDIKIIENKTIYVLKGLNLRIIADSPEMDLELATRDCVKKNDEVFDKEINKNIKKILMSRGEENSHPKLMVRSNKNIKVENSLLFGRPGKILHIDGDAEYLDVCLKTYLQLNLEVVGKVINEKKQPEQVLQLVKEHRPDIVVLTGHDSIVKKARDYMDIDNYTNSKYFVQSVSILRGYVTGYDDLVIFAGACQSCYEAILDAGANFASSPNRVLIHCLDPVFLTEKIAYTNVEKVISVKEVIKDTITGIDGIGGLQTRGKYREGYPKSKFA